MSLRVTNLSGFGGAGADPGGGASTFGHVSAFGKNGTAVNPISEAGGVSGQLAIVFVAATAGAVSTTPAGWTQINKAGPTATLSIGGFYKVLTGSEGSVTFLAAAGAIIVLIRDGAPSPVISDSDISVVTGSSASSQVKNASGVAIPLAVIEFGGVASGSPSSADFVHLYSGKSEVDDAEKYQSNATNVSAGAKWIDYGAGETPADLSASLSAGTAGVGLMSFILKTA